MPGGLQFTEILTSDYTNKRLWGLIMVSNECYRMPDLCNRKLYIMIPIGHNLMCISCFVILVTQSAKNGWLFHVELKYQIFGGVRKY